jgi:multidrug resistance efflux pump
MDILKPKTRSPWKRPVVVVITAVVILLLFSGFVLQPQNYPKIERDQLLFGHVQRGDMEVSVDGYGVLRSYKQTLLTAMTAATVEEVILRPGAQVESDSVILRLSNPELLQEVEAAGMALAQEQANLRRLKLNNQRELLGEQATLAQLDGEWQTITLRSNAEKGLAGAAVSRLAYQTTLLQQEQIHKRLLLQVQRIEQLQDVMHEAIIIQQEQINQAEAHYQNMRTRAERLTVRAGLQGVVQRLPVELGQSVIAGQELALVGSDKDLLALIRVSQSKAEQLQIGQVAQINTRREQVAGTVTRITPEIRDGTVEVEISFTDGVPPSARPELNVDAKIITSTLNNVLFVERPINVQSHSISKIYLIDSTKKNAVLHTVQFGEEADQFIQIVSGGSENDEFILSDMTRFRDTDHIRLMD